MGRIQRLGVTREFRRAPFGILNGQSIPVLAVASVVSALSAYAAGGEGNRESPVAVFEVIQVDTAQAKVKGLLRILNPTPDTLFLFPLREAIPLGQIEVTLYRGENSDVFRLWGAVDPACYDPDTLLPGGELQHPLTLGRDRWRTEATNLTKGEGVSQVKNPLRGEVRAIGLKYRMRYAIDVLKKTDYDGVKATVSDCPYDYYREPIVAPPVEVNLPR